MSKGIDHRVDRESRFNYGTNKFVNRVGLTGTVKWKPRLSHFRSGLPYCSNLLDFTATNTKLEAEQRTYYNECEFEIHGDRAVVFAKKIIKNDRILIFGSFRNGTDMGGRMIIYVMVDSFQWLGNMEKYMSRHNELAERRNDHYKMLKQLSEEEREEYG